MSLFLLVGLLLLGLFVQISTVLSQTCRRNSTITTSSPSFFCSANVTVAHTSSCNVRVTESFLLPYTTGTDVYRSIELFGTRRNAAKTVRQIRYRRDGRLPSQYRGRRADAFQVFGSRRNADGRLTLLRYRRAGQNAPLLVELPVDSSARLVLSTTRSNSPVLFELDYNLADGVVEAARTCRNQGTQKNEKYMSWALDATTKTVGDFRVRFVDQTGERVGAATTGYNVTSPRASEVIMSARNVRSGFLVQARVGNVSSRLRCKQRSGCFFISWKTIAKWSPILIVLIALKCLCAICCGCCKKVSVGGMAGENGQGDNILAFGGAVGASKIAEQHNANENFLASAGKTYY